MSIINPLVNLPRLGVAPVWAKLERQDGKGVYDFLVNPEEISWSHQAEFKSLPVLYTGQPLTNYVSSSSTLSIPRILFWTKGDAGDLTGVLAALKAMTKPVTPGSLPPLLKLTWGHLVEPRLHLRSFTYKEKQWRSGKTTQAEGSLEFIFSPVPAKPETVEAPKIVQVSSGSSTSGSGSATTSSAAVATKASAEGNRAQAGLSKENLAKANKLKVTLTFREIDYYKSELDRVLKADAKLGANLGIPPGFIVDSVSYDGHIRVIDPNGKGNMLLLKGDAAMTIKDVPGVRVRAGH